MSVKHIFLLALISGLSGNSAFSETTDSGKMQLDPPLLSRIELQEAKVHTRYNLVANDQGVATRNQLQHKEAFKLRFLFDNADRYSLNAAIGSGSTFLSSWDGLGLGNKASFNLNIRELFLTLQPWNGMELQYGGIAVKRGIATEITTYDNDAYLIGARIAIKKPRSLFFDEISATLAYLGDLEAPNVFERFDRYDQANYHQILISKKIGKRAVISGDYSSQDGIATLRQAIQIRVPEFKIIDSLRYENYQRIEGNSAYGFALQGDRKIRRWLTVGGGFANIDRLYGGLNADRFNIGRRFFAQAKIDPLQSLSADIFIQKAAANNYSIANDIRLDLALTYDLLSGIARLGIFRIPD